MVVECESRDGWVEKEIKEPSIEYKNVYSILAKYNKAKEYLFVQEEPENMGPWRFIDKNLRSLNLKYVGNTYY